MEGRNKDLYCDYIYPPVNNALIKDTVLGKCCHHFTSLRNKV